jgi:ubiquitin-protein ligase
LDDYKIGYSNNEGAYMSKITIGWDDLSEDAPPKVETANKITISFDDIAASLVSEPQGQLPPFSPLPIEPRPTAPVAEMYPYPRPPAGHLPPRLKRLYSDAERVATRLAKSPYIRLIEMRGIPPDYYRIEYNIRGIETVHGNNVIWRDKHEIELQLTSEYPNRQPTCTMLTPIFHPNISPSRICIGDHWTAGEKLVDLIFRIGEMIVYQSYNIRSPLDGKAARWADENEHLLPTDTADLIPPG